MARKAVKIVGLANHFRIDFPLGRLSICFWAAADGAFISKVVDKFVCGSECDSWRKAIGGGQEGEWQIGRTYAKMPLR